LLESLSGGRWQVTANVPVSVTLPGSGTAVKAQQPGQGEYSVEIGL